MHIRQAHGFYNWFRRPQLVLGSFSDDSHDFLPLPAETRRGCGTWYAGY